MLLAGSIVIGVLCVGGIITNSMVVKNTPTTLQNESVTKAHKYGTFNIVANSVGILLAVAGVVAVGVAAKRAKKVGGTI